MPTRPKRPCNHPGCSVLVDKGYCDKHKKKYDDSRKNTKETKFYNSSQWQRVRALKRKENPLCEQCEREGRITPAELVHHKKEVKEDWDSRFELENLESLCNACHERLHKRF